MTWQTQITAHRGGGILFVLFFLYACGDDPKKVTLKLTAPEPDAVLTTAADDADAERPGFQFDVVGESRGLRDNTTVNLFIAGEMTDYSTQLEADGSFTLEAVTLPPGTATIFVRTATGSVSSDEEQQYTLRALEITSPEDGASINASPGADGAEVDVTVEVFAIDTGEDIRLVVNGDELDEVQNPDSSGQAVFADVALAVGGNELRAVVDTDDGTIESEPIAVEVVQQCPAVTFLSPARSDGQDGVVTLGGDESCPDPESGDAFTTDIEISTDAGNGRSVELFVNDQPTQSATVSGSTARFTGVSLPNRSTTNVLTIEIENADGVTCTADAELAVAVDCAGPDCQITSPTPVDYIDDEDRLTLYLNAQHQSDDGFDIEVDTSAEVEGRAVSLIIDGRTASALEATAETDGDRTHATFAGVTLAEGAHTVEARCEDAAGNVTFSGESSWVVDTVACEVAVTDPAADTFYVPADDDDNDAANGTQVVVTASVVGADCVEQRAAVCDPATGVSGVSPVTYTGATPLLTTVTLDEDAAEQDLCVEILDRAGNVGLGSVDVMFRSDAPGVLIERPTSGDRYNALGNDGYVADVAPVSASVCDAEFWIACTELGQTVSLRYDGATGPVIGSGTCAAPASGDPAPPSGYAGRVKLVAPFADGDSTAVIVATQRVPASSGALLVGVSDPIALEGDCRVPQLAISSAEDPCSPNTSGQIAATNSVTDFTVSEVTSDPQRTVTVSLSHSVAGETGPFDPVSMSGNAFEFTGIDRGPVGDVTITVRSVDSFANVAERVCQATILADLPVIEALTMPANDQRFGPGSGCDTGDPTEYGVRVVATVDTDANRTANVLLDGAEIASDVPISGQTVDVCVPVPDDLADGAATPSQLTLQLLSDLGSGFAMASAHVHVATTRIDSPVDGQSLVSADNCAGVGFGYPVSATIDAEHQGASYTITSSNGGMLSGVVDTGGGATDVVGGCLDMAADASEEGPNTITLSIGGTTITRSVGVVVNNANPSNAISITEVELPASDDPGYRDALVTIRWPIPTEDWTGQLVAYDLRCARSPITTEDQWNDAPSVTLPAELLPGAPAAPGHDGMHEVAVDVPVGRSEQCVLRARDSSGQWTPLGGSADLTVPFREQVIISSPVSGTQAGWTVTAIGDVNDDGLDDVLVGNRGSASLVFGANPPSSITLNGNKTFVGGISVGEAIGGIGDFNGDSRNDFAIGDRTANSNAGRVSIFLGRTAAQWEDIPAQISIEGACNADLCLEHADAGSFLGWTGTIAPAGDFDGDGTVDLAVGAPTYPDLSGLGRAFVVLGSPYEEPGRACSGDGDCRPSEVCGTGGVCAPPADEFWGLRYELPSGNWTNPPGGSPVPTLRGFYIEAPAPVPPDQPIMQLLGQTFTSLGDFNGDDRADLVVSASGTTAVGGRLFHLAGRSYPGGMTGLVELDVDDFGGPGAAVLAGQPFAVGGSGFGTVVTGGANFFDDGDSGVADVVVHQTNANEVFIYSGDTELDQDERLRISGSGQLGASIARTFNPNLPPHPAFETPELLGDLDGDGLADLCVGPNTGTSGAPGTVSLFYASDVAATADAPDTPQAWAWETTQAAASSNIAPENDVVPQRREVAYVGDVNGDGHPDLVVGDRGLPGSSGRATLLY